MEDADTIRKWLDTLPPECPLVAIDDGGLCLVGLDADDNQTDAFLEIGGVPQKGDDDE